MSGNKNATRVMAVFCDFENIALGVRDANYERFDIGKVLERLLLKGNIVVKKAYCDWARYAKAKPWMHEASFELIEIPHVRMSGKNSADIRMVVDALDLCYTKEHVDTFVIISGDSDFSPLVSKLRENNKLVIGVGVKNSTSDLLIANCDEFIHYDDLVQKRAARRTRGRAGATQQKPALASKKTSSASSQKSKPTEKKPAAAQKQPMREQDEERQTDGDVDELWDLIVETYDALLEERGEEGLIWGSMIKQALKRRRPGFSESHYGFRSFGDVLEEAEEGGILELEQDEKSGGYIVRACHGE